MAQSEDTELRDLVVEALEKNGSLAKIRALLRANIFLAFEDEYENLKQNRSLDNILSLPEGKLSLCIIHEFLEFCNLKNTLFVYMAETRQGKDYTYQEEDMYEKLNVPKCDKGKEPILLTIVKDVMTTYQNKYGLVGITSNKKQIIDSDINVKDEQNCTYIVHEDTSNSSQSQSDNSSDEKNRDNLRLPLDNSDTDTSSDSARDKTSSEYIPNEQKLIVDDIEINKSIKHPQSNINNILANGSNGTKRDTLQEFKACNSSTDSTSYMDLKSLHPLDEILLNTPGLPVTENINTNLSHSSITHNESVSSIHNLNNNSNNLSKLESTNKSQIKQMHTVLDDSGLNDTEMEYSYDFSPPDSTQKHSTDPKSNNIKSMNLIEKNSSNTISNLSPSSQSSVSTSDVADLLSENSYRSSRGNRSEGNMSHRSRISNNRSLNINKDNDKINSDISSELSESSVPSLSNLNLEIHSE